MTDHELALRAVDLRRQFLQLIVDAGAGHTGGGLSSIDIMQLLYRRIMRVSPGTVDDPLRDRYVQSKGHCVEALYTVLADCGYFDKAALKTVCHYKSPYVGHPTRKIKGVEVNTGALGHGLPIAVGMALAARMDQSPTRVFTLLGDGELAEGSNWEAAQAAAHYRLDRLVAILDHNGLQITGKTRDVMSNEPLTDKWTAFGWHVRQVDGHDYAALTTALTTPPPEGQPLCLIANTIKGKGISFMENVGKWHHGVPTPEQFNAAIAELDATEAKLRQQEVSA